jgi:hypothetical protein
LSDDLVFSGYVALRGNSIDAAAMQFEEAVKIEYREKRWKRDGGKKHHITLLSRKEMEELSVKKTGKKKVGKELISETLFSMKESIRNDWVAVGLGRVEGDEQNEVYFVVCDWQSANDWREKNGLKPLAFHITIGFAKFDIHDKKKDRSTLIDQ